jgi:hypothetical protein
MSDEPTKDEDEYEQYAGPLTRFKKAARPIFALWALFGLAAMAIGLCVVAWGIWHDMSHAIAKTDWSWWTWPRVLLVLVVPLGDSRSKSDSNASRAVTA